jgi:hypothetical protein
LPLATAGIRNASCASVSGESGTETEGITRFFGAVDWRVAAADLGFRFVVLSRLGLVQTDSGGAVPIYHSLASVPA